MVKLKSSFLQKEDTQQNQVSVEPQKQLDEPPEKLKESYKDNIIDAIKAVLAKDYCNRRGIKVIQNGMRLVLYQGKRANIYGIVEARTGKPHFIRIHNSALLREFKKQEETKEIFKDIL